MSKAAEAMAEAIVTKLNWTKTITSVEIASLIDAHPDVKALVARAIHVSSCPAVRLEVCDSRCNCGLMNVLSSWLPSKEQGDKSGRDICGCVLGQAHTCNVWRRTGR